MNKPRLTDVAVHAGVSMKTVSNVVNGTGTVKPSTRARVQASIDALDYRPNVTARRLVTGQTGTISVAISSPTVPYYAEIANLIDRAAKDKSLRTVVEPTHGVRNDELAVLEQRERGLVDGVIFHPISLTPADLTDRSPGFPLVLLGEGPAPEVVDHVMIDNVAAARRMTAHLIARGCRQIAFLGVERDAWTHTTEQRYNGHQEALRAAGRKHDHRHDLLIDHYSADEGFRAVTAAIDAGTPIDAILCRDDSLAIGALHGLHTRGLAVPEDVAVGGWDDLIISRHLWPPLTTIAPAKSAIATTAVQLLSERIQGYTGPGRHLIIESELVERGSTARS